jgi:hypothetical protein
MYELIFEKSGITGLWVVFVIALSNTSIMDGSTVTQHTTPIRTPFAITNPISNPRVKLINIRATKPAIVVTELPITDTRVLFIAFAIALRLSSG